MAALSVAEREGDTLQVICTRQANCEYSGSTDRYQDLDRLLLVEDGMQGLITERHFASAEKWFPGIRRFYDALTDKPLTFLELVWEYERQIGRFRMGTGERRCVPSSRPER